MKVRNWVKEKGKEVTSQTLAAAFGEILKEVENTPEVERLVRETFERVRDEVSDDEVLREGLERDARVYFVYGDKGEGYWKGEDKCWIRPSRYPKRRTARHVFYSTTHPTVVSLQKMH